MIQLGQCLGFSQEPGADLVIRVEVDPETDPAVERLVVGDEQHSLPRGRYHVLEPVPVAEGRLGPLEIIEWRRSGHAAACRTWITAAGSRDSPGVVQLARGDRNAPGCTNDGSAGERGR